jgi:uncharacterized protein YwqG
MPTKHTIAYREAASPITDLITKFGGQPVWVGEPHWPLSRAYGTPMQFICQIALRGDLLVDVEPRMAYLFVTDDYEHGYVADTWEPDGGENALILQPGPSWDGPVLPLREGPSLYRRAWTDGRWERTACELTVELRQGDDPDAGTWDALDQDDTPAWNAYFDALLEDKIGGTPVPTVNKPEFPDPKDWRLLLQLNTKGEEEDDPFFLNFADEGVGYAFLSVDGLRGRFMWSR